MPWLPLPADHCQTAADVREQCGRTMRARMRARTIKRWVRINDQWVRTDRPRRASKRAVPIVRKDPGFVTDARSKEIITAIRMFFGCDEEDIFIGPKAAYSTDPRHVAMFLLRKVHGLSLPKLAIQFGLGHSSAMHACNRVAQLLVMDPEHQVSLAVVKVAKQCGVELAS